MNILYILCDISKIAPAQHFIVFYRVFPHCTFVTAMYNYPVETIGLKLFANEFNYFSFLFTYSTILNES